MEARNTPVRIFFVLLAFGLVSLFNLLSRPAFASVRAVDAVQLIGTGMCFGAAVASLVVHLRRGASRAGNS